MWEVTSDPQRAEEAIAWFRDRIPMLKEVWEALEERARRKAFTVAGVAHLDLIADVWAALDEAIATGITFEAFQAAASDRLAHNWSGENPSRVNTIFRTNVQMAYAAGRFQQITEPAVLKGRPFWLFDAVLDDGTTPTCRGLNGLVLPANDARWRGRIPPLHFQCRSGIRTLTRAQALERGIADEPPDHAAAEGFGAPPLEAEWMPEPDKYPPPLWAAYQEKNA